MTGRDTATRPRAGRPSYDVHVLGARAAPLRDFYHLLLRRSWAVTFGIIAVVFVLANAVFAVGYVFTGGIAQARTGSLADAFFFSVQTMATIGYGALYPRSPAANVLVVAESVVGIALTALATGLVFAKFSRPTARVVFSHRLTISPMNGVPTVVFRIGNERSNQIVDAHIHVSLVRTERTAEGKTFYRLLDLALTREHALTLTRSLSLLHPIDPTSPLHGATPESLAHDEVELQVLVLGLDDTTMQPVHAMHRYFAHDFVWGARPVDVLSEAPDGSLLLDLRKFHDIEPTLPAADFPYPSAGV